MPKKTPEFDLSGRVLGDTYLVERVLGRGGMGTVYTASHTRIERKFAIKVLNIQRSTNPDAIARFEREAMIGSRLGHDHIVQVMDFNHTPEGFAYIVMELLEGEDLHAVLRRQGKQSLEMTAFVLRQMGRALSAAHAETVIHRDLKPENVFICSRPGGSKVVKVLDFGISKVLDSDSVLTQYSAVMGTPNYMAPEQAEGRVKEIDLRTDIFSMGLILYHMLSGKMPFSGVNAPAVLFQVVHGEPVSLMKLRPDLRPEVVQVVERAIKKRRRDRYQDVKEMVEALSLAMGKHWKDSLMRELDQEERVTLQRLHTDREQSSATHGSSWLLAGQEDMGEATTELPEEDGGTTKKGEGHLDLPDPALATPSTDRSLQDQMSTYIPQRKDRDTEPTAGAPSMTGEDPPRVASDTKTLASPVRAAGDRVSSLEIHDTLAADLEQPVLSTLSRGTGEMTGGHRSIHVEISSTRKKGIYALAAALVLTAAGITAFFLMGEPSKTPAAPAASSAPADFSFQVPPPAAMDTRVVVPSSLAAAAPDTAPAPASAPTPVPTAPAQTRQLFVRSTPPGAFVLVGKTVLGKTPLSELSISIEVLSVAIRKTGYSTVTRNLPAGSGPAKLRVTLTPLPASLNLMALHDAKPVKAAVFLDGKKVDQAPAQLEGLTPGPHVLRLEREGYQPKIWKGKLHPGEKKRLVLEMKKP